MANYGVFYCNTDANDEIISEVNIDINIDIFEYEDEIFKEKMDGLVDLIREKTYELIEELKTRQKK